MAGGGATGVELAGTLAELSATVLAATFPDVDPARIHVRLIEMAPALLGGFHEKLREYARVQLDKRGVDIRLDTQIAEITDQQVLLADGQSPAERPDRVGGRRGRGRGRRGLGPAPEPGRPHRGRARSAGAGAGPDLRRRATSRSIPTIPTPQLAQPALQMGRHAAAQIVRLQRQAATEPFAYHDKGTMATIGRRSAVVQLAQGLRLRGTLAWLSWLVLHLFYLLGGRNRVSTHDQPDLPLLRLGSRRRGDRRRRSRHRSRPSGSRAGAR